MQAMDVIGNCCTLLSFILTSVAEVQKACEKAKENKEKYQEMSKTVEISTIQLKKIYVPLLYNNKKTNINDDSYSVYESIIDNLQLYLNAVNDIKEIVKKYNKPRKLGLPVIFTAGIDNSKITNLENRYARAVRNLNFVINMENRKKIEELGDQVQEVRKDNELILKTLEEGIEGFNKKLDSVSKDVAKDVHKVNKGEYKISLSYEEFDEKVLTDPRSDSVSVSVSVRGKVFKKMLQNIIEVACVPQTYINNNELKATLSILSKLHSSDSIIKFHGTSRVNNENVLIFDWAHMGNLKYVYGEYNKENKLIPWKKKLKIARDICLGLQFLHKCEFYHRDVRCKNILIMGPGVATAKISNFFLSRNFVDISRAIKSEEKYEMDRWTAPEKLKKTAYSVECEVFSFGMLLWELSFQQVPYYTKFGNDYERISQHVLNERREDLNFDCKHSGDIQQCFKEIISTAWKHKPDKRLKLQDILTKLDTLYNKYYLSSIIKHGVDKTSTFEEEDGDDDGGHNTCGDDSEESSTETKNSTIPLEQGIIFHKEETPESRKKAWQCFLYHADVLNSPLAKYWKGYYLLQGYAGVDINREEAIVLFKEASDYDVGDAQFFYAKLIKPNANHNSSVAKECIEYFEMAAMNGVPYAMYYLGDIYYYGKYHVKKDQDRAMSYFKEAAKNGVKEAKEKLEKINKKS